jgi:hypothetical protein
MEFQQLSLFMTRQPTERKIERTLSSFMKGKEPNAESITCNFPHSMDLVFPGVKGGGGASRVKLSQIPANLDRKG